MKILLTGILSPMIWDMVDRLVREGHQVSLLGHGLAPAPAKTKATVHDLSPGNPEAAQVLEAGRFSLVVFFYAYQSEDTRAYGSIQGSMLDALFQLQHTAATCGVERFFLVTDVRVFGAGQAGREDETPLPQTPTGVLINAAEEVLRCVDSSTIQTLLIRVSHLYSPGREDAFFSRVRQSANAGQPMLLDGTADTLCDFLHVDDLSLFITLALEHKLTGIVHLAYGDRFSYAEVANLLQARLPELQVTFSETRTTRTMLQSNNAHRQTQWVPRHRWVSELDEIIAGAGEGPRKRSLGARLSGFLRKLFGSALPWVELVVLAVIAELLMRTSEYNATFRFLDYWLFYVILMGSIHGGPVGMAAGVIACIGYSFSWFESGNDVYLLLYNKDNWLPLIMYIFGGGVFGYMHDRNAEKLAAMRQEMEQRDEEAKFIQSMYQQVDADRNALQEQVIRFRDSYGRIYAITQELDTLQPEQVFLSTLDVLEDVMQNQSVALYTCSQESSFARLVVHSRAMEDLPKSMDLKEYPLLDSVYSRGEIFANSKLEPGYPAFCAPVMQDGNTIALIALWDVPFEQQTLYRQNLFSVVAGLVQSAMVRALHYFDSAQDMYIENTHILTDKAFRSTLSVYSQMRKKRAAQYLLLAVQSVDGVLSIEEYDRRIGKATRRTDIAGRLKNGQMYVLLPQASLENMPQIERRFLASGLSCTVTS
ncbi:MAG TPA: NAD(P)-dependent oxidoreductase [Candidatus Limiplasma sp.]|nr:NAD(P)-dependent oxidoreductase [Candidatus Limiplasma sp.]HRX08268.1 NAD(P)-dependent oxidoreductase [Candidatus Limiplasma sp.]